MYHPEGHPFGWRYVLDFTEDEIRNQQDWPANIKQRQKEKEPTTRDETQQQEKKQQQKEDASGEYQKPSR